MAFRAVSVPWVITCLNPLTVKFGGPACGFALFNDEQGAGHHCTKCAWV